MKALPRLPMPRQISNKASSLCIGRYFTIAAAAICVGVPAHASFIDSDPICQTYGCVVIHDGVSFDVYDNFDASTGRPIAVGERMVRRSTNPILGTGEVHPVITGSLTEGFSVAPLQDQGSMLGIDTNGDGNSDIDPIDANGSGFLDAGDSLDIFEITGTTSIVGGNTSSQRSFYVSSTTDFYLTAEILTSLGGNISSGLAGMGFTYRVQRRGRDDGMSFGRSAMRGNQYRPIGAISTLADLAGGPVRIMEFRRSVSRRRSNSLPDQSVRFDYVYDLTRYDLSMGEGSLNFEIEFDFINR